MAMLIIGGDQVLHSAISLSSNAFSQKTFSFGTFEELSFKNFYLHSKIIVMPYESLNKEKLFFSGFKGHLSYLSNKTLITIGAHRSFSSGNFESQTNTNAPLDWSINDAAMLVFAPLFTKDKKDLDLLYQVLLDLTFGMKCYLLFKYKFY